MPRRPDTRALIVLASLLALGGGATAWRSVSRNAALSSDAPISSTQALAPSAREGAGPKGRTSTAPVMSSRNAAPAASPSSLSGREQQFQASFQEWARITRGGISQDPAAMRSSLAAFARSLSTEELHALGTMSADPSQDWSSRHLSAYLLARADSPAALPALEGGLERLTFRAPSHQDAHAPPEQTGALAIQLADGLAAHPDTPGAIAALTRLERSEALLPVRGYLIRQRQALQNGTIRELRQQQNELLRRAVAGRT